MLAKSTVILGVLVFVLLAVSTPASYAAFPGANGKIAFQTFRDGNAEVYVMNADGTGQTNTSNNLANDYVPTWSPDGTKIAFQTDRDGNQEIYVMNADGTGQTNLTNNSADDNEPAWSPDGTKIAFTSGRDGNQEIYVMNADGTGQTNLTNNAALDNIAAWSPDGSKIAFQTNRDGNDEIYVMNADGTGQTNLTNNTGKDNSPAWSPDGTKIVFYTERDGNFEVYVMNADGSGQTNLSNNGSATDITPAWSPDGGKIAFQTNRDGNDEIYVMNADGTGQTNLTNNSGVDGWADWQTLLIFTSPRNWIQLSPTGTPPAPRYSAGNAYDEVNDRLILFSGEGFTGLPRPIDVWVLTNASGLGGTPSWIQLTPAGVSPLGRELGTVVYDPTSNRIIVHAGCSANCSPALSDVWVLTNANGLGGTPAWAQLPDAPIARSRHTATYDPNSNRMIIFGGDKAFPGTELNDVWVLSDANGIGSPTWIQLFPSGTPPPTRIDAAAVYDQANNRMVVYGGSGCCPGFDFNDVWVLTNANGLGGTPQWLQLSPAGVLPAARRLHSLAYDPVTNQMILFGGASGPTLLTYNDVWILTAANGIGGTPQWVPIFPSDSPPLARFGHSVGYAAGTNQMIVAMGRNDHASPSLFNDVWVLVPGSLPITVDAGGPYNGNEGTPIPLNGSVSAPDGTTLTFDWTVDPALCTFDDPTILTPTLTCDDNDSYTVTLTVNDGVSSNATVAIGNVAPTATFSNDGPADEGSDFSLSLTNPADPSGADTSAGFEYAFDCGDGAGLGAFSTSNSAVCPTDDNGIRAVKGQIKDKDGGVTEYTASVTLNNVKPTVDVGPDATIIQTETFIGTGSFSDPGADIWTATVDYGDGSDVQPLTLTGKNFSLSHVYDNIGLFVVTVTIDDVSEVGSDDLTVTVQTPQNATEDVIDEVTDLVNTGALNQGQSNALISKLANIIAKLDEGNVNAAINQLQAFINQVTDLINTGELLATEGQPLIDAANEIINAVNG